MRTRQDLERYLMASAYLCDEVAEGTWVIREPQQPEERIVVRVEGDLVVLRLNVLPLARVGQREALFEKLLSWNASDMAHGAYAISNDQVILTAAHRLETLDEEELRASIDDFVLAVQNHHGLLKAYCADGGQA